MQNQNRYPGDSPVQSLIKHLRKFVFRGLVVGIPLALTVFAVRFVYIMIDRRIASPIDRWLGFAVPGLGIFILVLLLYAIGIAASNFVGARLLLFAERIIERVPLINTTYRVGRQLSSTLSLPEGQIFRRAVLVEYLRTGSWTIGFVTGSVVDRTGGGEKILKVFVPTPPNPASGNLLLVREAQTRDPGWTVEEAVKAVISGGILSPPELRGRAVADL